jgi:hypothetical protein
MFEEPMPADSTTWPHLLASIGSLIIEVVVNGWLLDLGRKRGYLVALNLSPMLCCLFVEMVGIFTCVEAPTLGETALRAQGTPHD